MAIDRRALLISLIASAVAPDANAAARRSGRLYVSCRMDAANDASVAVFDEAGCEVFSTRLPSRGHDTAARPMGGEIVIFARRPGNWFVAARRSDGAIIATVHSAKDRHFYGHGVFSSDGKLLHATENDTVTGNGVIGIYDATSGYKRVAEFASGGIGPHDIALMPGGERLLAANGGLRTHPGSGREILNPSDMRPNIAVLDIRDGGVLSRVELEANLRKLSIRHLAVMRNGTAAFGCQYEGGEDDLPPLVGLLSPNGKVTFLDAPEDNLGRMRNYVGSVAFDDSEEILAATSPRGGQILMWSVANGSLLRTHAISDACGIAASGARRFLASSGNAGLGVVSAGMGHAPQPMAAHWIWDNHLRRIADRPPVRAWRGRS